MMEANRAIKIFKNIFPNIKFTVKNNISEEIKQIFNEHSNVETLNSEDNLKYLLIYLESELKYAKKKLTSVKKLYKKNEASIYEVQEHEYNVFEIEEEIEEIKYLINLK